MASMTIVHQGLPSDQDDFGLSAIAKHNAQASTEQFPVYHEDAKGLGIYVSTHADVHLSTRTRTYSQTARWLQPIVFR